MVVLTVVPSSCTVIGSSTISSSGRRAALATVDGGDQERLAAADGRAMQCDGTRRLRD